MHYVTNPLMRGFFRLDRSGNAGFLVVNLVGDTSRPEVIAAFPDAPWANVAEGITEQRALELLRAAIGVPDIPVVIDDIATDYSALMSKVVANGKTVFDGRVQKNVGTLLKYAAADNDRTMLFGAALPIDLTREVR